VALLLKKQHYSWNNSVNCEGRADYWWDSL